MKRALTEPQSETERHKKARQEGFLTAYEQVGSIVRASEAAKIGRTTHWQWIKDAEYAKAFAGAQIVATETLIDEARRRAVDGVEEPVGFYLGESNTTVKRYSDNLLMFLIKAARPEYRDSSRIQIGLDAAGDGDPKLGEKTLAAAMGVKLLAEG